MQATPINPVPSKRFPTSHLRPLRRALSPADIIDTLLLKKREITIVNFQGEKTERGLHEPAAGPAACVGGGFQPVFLIAAIYLGGNQPLTHFLVPILPVLSVEMALQKLSKRGVLSLLPGL